MIPKKWVYIGLGFTLFLVLLTAVLRTIFADQTKDGTSNAVNCGGLISVTIESNMRVTSTCEDMVVKISSGYHEYSFVFRIDGTLNTYRLQSDSDNCMHQGGLLKCSVTEGQFSLDVASALPGVIGAVRLQRAPEFTLTGYDFNEYSLDSFLHQDSPVVVHFFETWCSPCIDELPTLVAAAEKYDVAFLIVSRSPRDDVVSAFENAGAVPKNFVLLIGTQEVHDAYMLQGFPTTIILNSNGRVQWRYTGGVYPDWTMYLESEK